MKILKLFLFSTFLILNSLFLILVFPSPVYAQLPTLPTSQLPGAQGVVEIQALEQIFANVLTIVTSFVGLIGFVIIISGGFKWLTSGGDPKKIEAAKHAITNVVLGFVFLILIWFILIFIERFTGVQITIFTIPK